MSCDWYWGSHGCDRTDEHQVHTCGTEDDLCSQMRVIEGPVGSSWAGWSLKGSPVLLAEVRFWYEASDGDCAGWGEWTGNWTSFHMSPWWPESSTQ